MQTTSTPHTGTTTGYDTTAETESTMQSERDGAAKAAFLVDRRSDRAVLDTTEV